MTSAPRNRPEKSGEDEMEISSASLPLKNSLKWSLFESLPHTVQSAPLRLGRSAQGAGLTGGEGGDIMASDADSPGAVRS